MPAILIIKTSSLGDVIHNLPIVADIHAHVPGAEVDWVVEDAYADIPRLHPGVRRVIPVAVRRWRRAWWNTATWSEVRACARELRARDYDIVIDTQGLVKSAIIGACARGPIAGQDRATAREWVAALFYRHPHAIARGRHAVIRNRELAARALGYSPPHTPPEYGIADPASSASSKRYAVVLHATSRVSKRWPDSCWIDVTAELARNGIAARLPSGNSAERAHAERLAAQIPGATALAPYSLRELTDVLREAAIVIGVDTGLVHLAGALGRPTVALFVDSDPVLTGVLPADPSTAVNLGGPGNPPSPDAVRAALRRLGAY